MKHFLYIFMYINVISQRQGYRMLNVVEKNKVQWLAELCTDFSSFLLQNATHSPCTLFKWSTNQKRNLNKWVGKNNESTCFFTGQWMAWGKWCESLMCCSQNSTLLNRQRSSSPSSKHLEHLWQGALKHRLKLFALICHSSVSVTTACHVMSTGFCTQPMINRSEMTLCMMRIWVPMKM